MLHRAALQARVMRAGTCFGQSSKWGSQFGAEGWLEVERAVDVNQQ
jgi:hypothetical protein